LIVRAFFVVTEPPVGLVKVLVDLCCSPETEQSPGIEEHAEFFHVYHRLIGFFCDGLTVLGFSR
jgi:hypothetical protein